MPFGRTKVDPVRIAAIEAGRRRAAGDAVRGRPRVPSTRLRARLSELTPADWQRTGSTRRSGTMSIADQLQHFHVGHYEEHAEQLES